MSISYAYLLDSMAQLRHARRACSELGAHSWRARRGPALEADLMLRATTVAAFAIGISAGTGGCAVRIGDLTVMSSRNVPLSYPAEGSRTFGRHCPFFTQPNIEEAFDRAVTGANGDYNAMVDVVIYRSAMCFRVEGTPVKLQ